MENRNPAAQLPHAALTVLAMRPELFARQGHVAATWRTHNGKRFGPYYRLAFRENGRQHSIYLGRPGELVDRVRHTLQTLQKPLQQHRAFNQLRRTIRAALRVDRRTVDAHLRSLGLRLKGFEVRGWRTSPLRALLRIGSLGRDTLAKMRPKPFRLPRTDQLRHVPQGRAAKWIRENQPKIPRLPADRLQAFLDARDRISRLHTEFQCQ